MPASSQRLTRQFSVPLICRIPWSGPETHTVEVLLHGIAHAVETVEIGESYTAGRPRLG